MKTQAIATKLPADLTRALDDVCKRMGLRKNFVLETALREKIEDLLDDEDLQEAVREATGFHTWEEVKKERHRGNSR